MQARVGRTVQHGRAQLVQPSEGQLHLRLYARRAHDPAAGGPPGQEIQQRGLTHARLTPHHQGPALAGAHVSDEPVKHGPFGQPVHQAGRQTPGYQDAPSSPMLHRDRGGDAVRDGKVHDGKSGQERRAAAARPRMNAHNGLSSQTPPMPGRQPTRTES